MKKRTTSFLRLILIRFAPATLNPGPVRFCLQPPLPLAKAGFGGAPVHGAHRGLANQVQQPFQCILPVGILRAVAPRGDDDHPVHGELGSGQRLQAGFHLVW